MAQFSWPLVCKILILTDILTTQTIAGAYPQRHQMNGFRSAAGTVTDAHWKVDFTNSVGHKTEVWIHYHFEGTVAVTDDVVNGVKTDHLNFIGGHSCRRIIAPYGLGKKDAQAYINKNYPRGKQETVYYKLPNDSKCYTLSDVNYNYNVGVTLLTLFGAGCCCPLFLFFCLPLLAMCLGQGNSETPALSSEEYYQKGGYAQANEVGDGSCSCSIYPVIAFDPEMTNTPGCHSSPTAHCIFYFLACVSCLICCVLLSSSLSIDLFSFSFASRMSFHGNHNLKI